MLLALFVFSAGLPPAPCQADIYRWKDQQGYWHFSDAPTSDAPIRQPPQPEYDGSAAKRPSARPADSPAASAGTASGPDASAAPVHEGMLWRISRSGTVPSYLLGTIHSADPRVVHLRPAVQRALDRSDRFVMEMQMNANALLTIGSSMMMTDGKDLEALLGSDLYGQVVTAMAGYGYPETAVRHLKPWVVMALLSMPKPSDKPVLDMVLYQRARNAGKPTAGLESAQEQLAVFEGLSEADQIALLKMTIAQLPALPGLFDQLIRAYAADDLPGVARLAADYASQGATGAVKRFVLRLNDERNRRMADRMIPYLQQGNSFIAVGALHLAGPTGLIHLLRARGYDAAPVP